MLGVAPFGVGEGAETEGPDAHFVKLAAVDAVVRLEPVRTAQRNGQPKEGGDA